MRDSENEGWVEGKSEGWVRSRVRSRDGVRAWSEGENEGCFLARGAREAENLSKRGGGRHRE